MHWLGATITQTAAGLGGKISGPWPPGVKNEEGDLRASPPENFFDHALFENRDWTFILEKAFLNERAK